MDQLLNVELNDFKEFIKLKILVNFKLLLFFF